MDKENNLLQTHQEGKFKIFSYFVIIWTILQILLEVLSFGAWMIITVMPFITMIVVFLIAITLSLLLIHRHQLIKNNYLQYRKISSFLLWIYIIATTLMILASIMFTLAL